MSKQLLYKILVPTNLSMSDKKTVGKIIWASGTNNLSFKCSKTLLKVYTQHVLTILIPLPIADKISLGEACLNSTAIMVEKILNI